MDKQKLTKLIKIVSDISKLEDNKWFTKKLVLELSPRNSTIISSYQMDEIYEYCLSQILKEHAENFYKHFKIIEIKPQLVKDFIRMERFRRENNFEDFCLALFQQIESIINNLMGDRLKIKIQSDLKKNINQKTDEEGNFVYKKTVRDIIFYPSLSSEDINKKFIINKDKSKDRNPEWTFAEKYKAVLYYFYFKENISYFENFTEIYKLGDLVYTIRNLNHRGGKFFEKQEQNKKEVMENSHRYYYKFMTFLENFSYTINENIT